MTEITVINTNLPEPIKVTSTRTQFDFPEGTTLDYAPSLTPSDYKIIYNNIEYPLTNISDDNTKIIYAYTEEEHTNTTFQLEYFKATGKATLYIRQAYVEVVVGAQFMIVCNVSSEGADTIIRFDNGNAIKINYNLETGSINYEIIKDETVKPSNKIYLALIRFTNDKALKIRFNSETMAISIKEV